MMKCYFHPKLDASHQCKSCQLPICPHCVNGLHCPDCIKRLQYVEGTSSRKPRLVMPPKLKSMTQELILSRLHARAGQTTWVPTWDLEGRKTTHFGFLLPGITPKLRAARKLRRNRLTAAAMVILIASGLLIMREHLGWAQGNPRVHMAAPTSRSHEMASHPAALRPTPAPAVRTVYVYVPVSAPAPVPPADPTPQPPPMQRPLYSLAPHRMTSGPLPQLTLPASVHPAAVKAVVAAAPKAPNSPLLRLTWPLAGSNLRKITVVRVAIADAQALSRIRLTVDGRPFGPIMNASRLSTIPWDTTEIGNGDHVLRVIGEDSADRLYASDELPITVAN